MNKLALLMAIGLFSVMLASLNVRPVKTDPTIYEIMHYGNLGAVVYYQVVAPIDVKIGESFSVDINFNVNDEIRVPVNFDVWIHGAGTDWFENIAGDGDVVPAGTITRNPTVKATQMGAVWCDITLGFYDSGDSWYFGSSSFGICMPRSKTYDELQSDYSELELAYNGLEDDYESLNSTYESLETDYNLLQVDYDDFLASYDTLSSRHTSIEAELSHARNLMYIFLVTTLAFIATTIYFARRKPKVKSA